MSSHQSSVFGGAEGERLLKSVLAGEPARELETERGAECALSKSVANSGLVRIFPSKEDEIDYQVFVDQAHRIYQTQRSKVEQKDGYLYQASCARRSCRARCRSRRTSSCRSSSS